MKDEISVCPVFVEFASTNLFCPQKDFVLDDGEYTTFKTEKL